MKAHKLFSKERNKQEDANLDTLSEEVSFVGGLGWKASLENQFILFIIFFFAVVIETIIWENSCSFNDHG